MVSKIILRKVTKKMDNNPVDTVNDPDFQLWGLLHQTAHIMQRVRSQELSQFDSSMMQATVLWAVKAVSPPATPTKISRWLARRTNTVSSMLDRLEKKGLICRTRAAKANKATTLELTEEGEKIANLSVTEISDIRNILSCLTDEQRSDLVECLRTLRRSALRQLLAMEHIPSL